MPMVSIITITYNRVALLKETIESVLYQTHADFEYVIIDDGSEDATAALIKSFADSRLKYYHLSHSGKISLLRNFGIKQSKGNLIAFIDSDDTWKSGKIASQVKAFNEFPEAGFVFTDALYFSAGSVDKEIAYSKKHRHAVPVNFFPEVIHNRLSIYPSSIMFRQACMQKAGEFNENMIGGDMDFITRLAFEFKGILLPQPLAKIRMHGANHSKVHGVDAHLESIETLNLFYLKKAVSYLAFRRWSGFHQRAVAKIFFERGELRKSRTHYVKSILLNPADWKSMGGLLKAFLK